MGIQNVGELSLGQYTAICKQWNKAHGGGKPVAPSDDDFDEAVKRARMLH
jgi:hypothetical protein